MTSLHWLGLSDAAAAIRDRSVSALELTRALLDRIAATEGDLRAWVVVDGERALREAASRDESRAEGPLHGVPVGIKDIFDVAGLATVAGFEPFGGRIAARDSTAVARLRAAGAVILGKTVTTQFASFDPPPTRNPWSVTNTPGGSSSGSAASVATGQVPGALGSQTGGSVLRPAAYCGVVGVKPTYGRVSRAGVLPFAWSLDHPGVFGRSVADCALALTTIAGRDPADPSTADRPVANYAAAVGARTAPSLVVLDDFLERADGATREAFEQSIRLLTNAGARVRRSRFPSGAGCLIAAHSLTMHSEAASVHRRLHAESAEHYAPKIRAYVESGLLVSAADYIDAQRLRRRLRREAEGLLSDANALALPTASSAAPGTDTTGDPSFQAPFSLLGLPAISLPAGSCNALPLGLQLVARAWDEEGLFGAAAWCEQVLPAVGRPPGYA